MKKKVLILIIPCLLALTSTAQNVTNVRFEQDGKMVKIYYDLSEEADISIYLSADGGKTYESSPLGHLNGHAGEGVAAGTSRCAVWDVLADREKLQGSDIRFKVNASPNAENCYRKGQNCYAAHDDSEAVKWYRRAAEQGHADAQCDLGYMYNMGYGVAQNYSEAVKWYRKAAEQGEAYAQRNLGLMYYNGYGVAQDYTEAVKWYRRAAEQGYAVAQYDLASMYYNDKDYSEAAKWFRKAAEQGNEGAQFTLGYMYDQGYGVEKNHTEALKWYRKLADHGWANMQYVLGHYYEYGTGVERNVDEAIKWYRMAADQGNEDAMAALKRLGK